MATGKACQVYTRKLIGSTSSPFFVTWKAITVFFFDCVLAKEMVYICTPSFGMLEVALTVKQTQRLPRNETCLYAQDSEFLFFIALA